VITHPKLQLTVDCADPERLAVFWAAALGYEVEPPPAPFTSWRAYWLDQGLPEEELGTGEGSDSVVDPRGVGPRIWFQQVPEPKTVKNRLHLDLHAGPERREAEVDRLVALGATVLARIDEPGTKHVTLADPEGNEFCVQ